MTKLLLKGGKFGLSEVGQRTISLATTFRYAVLLSAQFLALWCSSAHSLCTSLATCFTCTADDDEKLPLGATKYLVVEFNAWVYSGVRVTPTPGPRSTEPLNTS